MHDISTEELQELQQRQARGVRCRASRTLQEDRPQSQSRSPQGDGGDAGGGSCSKAKAKSRSKAAASGQTAPKENKKAALPVASLQLRPRLQHHRQPHRADPHVQMEALVADVEDEESSGGRQKQQAAMEAESQMDPDMHGRFLASLWGHLGSTRQLCFNPKVYPLALGEAEEVREPGVEGIQLTDPNALTTAEQRRRAMERLDIVVQSGPCPRGDLRPGRGLFEEPLQTGVLEETRQTGDLRPGREAT